MARKTTRNKTRNSQCNIPRNISQVGSSATRRHTFKHPVSKIMNTPTTPQPTPDLESLRAAVQEFRPNPHRVPFNNLKPFHDSIAELRNKNASYFIIAEILQQNGVKTSRARVAEYGRIILDGGKSRKRRKRARTVPVVNAPATPQSAPAVAAKPAPATPAPASANTSYVPSPASENNPYKFARTTHR
jgi:hypothetical protein